MQEICNYQIEIEGDLDENLFNAESPVWIKLNSLSQELSRFSVLTDQPGVIGLIRHLHRQGFLLLSLHRESSLFCPSSKEEQAHGRQ